MTSLETLFWKRVAEELAIEVVTPFKVSFRDGSTLQVAALVKNFGAINGMLVNANYEALDPHAQMIKDSGYGYSSNIGSKGNFDRFEMIEVLKDWGWTGAEDEKPDWLQ